MTEVPPWWPPDVHRPGTPDWELSAVSWLLDQVPGDWREHNGAAPAPGAAGPAGRR